MAICLVSDRDKGVAVLWRGFMRDRFYKVGKVSDMYELLQIAAVRRAMAKEAILSICEIASCPALLEDKHFIADVILL